MLKDISPEYLKKLKNEGVVLIDIRTPMEWQQTGVVPGSKLLTFFDEFGRYNIDAFMDEFQKLVPTKDTPFVLICRTGSRTATVGNFLANQMGYTNAMHLAGGIYSWHADGNEFEPISQ
ncbi:rhodanese-like domain-containing protein [Nitratiruptor sp. SB155-2]|uniref:rhodanese-like domain-containing protein n=1 Tax=Nitratiruptor sp. (strain SB155-2) TaxID=387092 RepID=UPI00015872E6|nr:rhodanese-like domain-containing protein [Nitratiruptor sp. SB155-2]BAF70714.1 rhodanese family protein [Nitratiruptor sp. SB155-2]